MAACVEAHAWEGEKTLELDVSFEDHKVLDDSLQLLQLQGIVKSLEADPSNTDRRSWQITAAGAGSVRCGMVLLLPRSATEPRAGVKVESMTARELVWKLEEDGWHARVAFSPAGLEPVRSYGPQVFWSKKKSKVANMSYLIALAHRNRLFSEGVCNIFHLKPAAYYNELLANIGVSRGKPSHRKPRAGRLRLVADDGTAQLIALHRQARKRAGGDTRDDGTAGAASSSSGARDQKASEQTTAAEPAELALKKRRRAVRGRARHPRSYRWGPH